LDHLYVGQGCTLYQKLSLFFLFPSSRRLLST